MFVSGNLGDHQKLWDEYGVTFQNAGKSVTHTDTVTSVHSSCHHQFMSLYIQMRSPDCHSPVGHQSTTYHSHTVNCVSPTSHTLSPTIHTLSPARQSPCHPPPPPPGLDPSTCLQKMKLLTLTSLAASSTEVDFSLVEQELQIESSEVERTVIEGTSVCLCVCLSISVRACVRVRVCWYSWYLLL